MTVLIDTSILIEAQRRPTSDHAREFTRLVESGEAALAGPVIMEFLTGARPNANLDSLIERLSPIAYLEMDRQAWIAAGSIGNDLMRVGEPLSGMDLAIAAAAIQHDVPLYTLDTDFERIPQLRRHRLSATE